MKDSLVKDKSELTKSEMKICDYIEEYMNNSIYMTVTEIANGCGVGEATVTRFCRKLGFRSFLEFKMKMAQEFNNSSSNQEMLNEDNLIHEDSVELVAKNYYETNINLLKNCANTVDYKQIDKISDEIMNSNRVYIVGVGQSGMLAESCAYKLLRCGIECNFYREITNIYIMAKLVKKNDVIFVISNSGNIKELNTAIEEAKERGAIVIALTSNFISKLARTSDYTISYVNKEFQTPTGDITSEIQQIYIFDLIYNNILRKQTTK